MKVQSVQKVLENYFHKSCGIGCNSELQKPELHPSTSVSITTTSASTSLLSFNISISKLQNHHQLQGVTTKLGGNFFVPTDFQSLMVNG